MSQTFENNTPPPTHPNMPVVFGQALETLVKTQQAQGSKSDIPSVITDIILWLDAHQAITAANIFRALGHAPTVQAIKNEFEAGKWNAANHKREDMHSIAATLKLYLRTLPDSPFPSKYYSLALRIVREVSDPIQQAYELRVCVYTFPKANRDTLLYLANFLHRVAHRHKDNGVDSRTLAQTVGPYLLRPPPTHAPPYSPDSLVIPADADAVTAVVQRIIEEAPFFFKTTSKPLAVPKEQASSHPPPTVSTLKGKALYPYPGGGKWLLVLKKEDAPTLLDIKNEEGWLRVELNGEIGYVPLAYVQLVPGPQPPADAQRGGIPLEFDASALEPVVPAQTPQLDRKTGSAFGSMTQLPRLPTESPLLHTVLSPDYVPSPLLSPKFASPDLSHLPITPPPPLVAPPSLATPPLHTANADLLPPPVDISNIPPPLSSSLPSSVPPGAFGSSPPSSSPRGLSAQNSASFPNLPPVTALSPPTMPANKSSSFIGTSSTSSPLSTSAGADGASHLPHPAHPTLPTKMTRAFSYSAPPPPRLVAPPLPIPGAKTDDTKKDEKDDEKDDKDDEKTDRTDRTDKTDKTSGSERHEEGEGEDGEDEDETSDEDFDGSSASEDVPPPPVLPPPPAPALPTSLNLDVVTDTEKDAVTAKKRKERAEEVLSTERTYVKQLTVVYDYYLEPLKRKEREKTPILSATDIFAIFSNIEVILNCHRKLLDTLEKRMQTWDSNPEVGDIFLPENTAFIKLYKYYVNGFDKSIITLKSCREKNPDFQKFAQDLDYTEKLSGLSIESFLILPVQRIPRYVLLLQDLLKYTHSTHKDFNNLSNALSFIKDLADFINANKSDADNINRILGIQETLLDLPADFNLVVPRRRFIEEGGLLYKKQKAWMYLFSDALLFTKVEKKGKRFKTIINLPTASLNLNDEPGVIKIISTEGTFKFNGETPKDRDHWVKIIRETMDASRVDMLNSAFGDNHTDSGSNKQFMKIKEEENAAKKRNVVDRLIASEQEYVESITYISKTFLAPLRKAVDSPMPMIALSELIDISSNLETLLNCHIAFLQALKDRVAEWNDKSYVFDLFEEKAAFLKLYNYYVSNHHKSLEMLDHCIEKYPLFAIFLRDLEAREKAELKVLLTEPLRRVSTYYLIVQEMLQYIKPRTDEHDHMAKVVSKLKEQTEKLNADLHDHMVTGKKVDKDKKIERAKSSRKFRMSNNSK